MGHRGPARRAGAAGGRRAPVPARRGRLRAPPGLQGGAQAPGALRRRGGGRCQRRAARDLHAVRLRAQRSAERLRADVARGFGGVDADDRDRRRVRRARRRGGPRRLPGAVRAARVHDRQRLLSQGRPERRRRRTPRPTPAGRRRSRWISTWPLRSARTATSCSSRPARAAFTDLVGGSQPAQLRSARRRSPTATAASEIQRRDLARVRLQPSRDRRDRQLRRRRLRRRVPCLVAVRDRGRRHEPAARRRPRAAGPKLPGRAPAAAARRTSPKPSWQTDSGCARRSVADVSAVADPNTGVAVYDSFAYQGSSGWMVFGGTSAASPIVASADALIGPPAAVAAPTPTTMRVVQRRDGGQQRQLRRQLPVHRRAPATTDRRASAPRRAPLPSGRKPAAVTQAASSIGATGATFNGSVRAYGVDTTYHFEYGTTTSYGSRWPAVDADAGSGTTSVTVPVHALGPVAGHDLPLPRWSPPAPAARRPAPTRRSRPAPPAAGTSDGSDQTSTTGVESTAATPPATTGSPPAPQPATGCCKAAERRRVLHAHARDQAPAAHGDPHGPLCAGWEYQRVYPARQAPARPRAPHPPCHRHDDAAPAHRARAFGSHRLLKLTFKVTVVDATGARRVLHRHVKISR